jgi:hypothetical protein
MAFLWNEKDDEEEAKQQQQQSPTLMHDRATACLL